MSADFFVSKAASFAYVSAEYTVPAGLFGELTIIARV